MKRTMSLLFAGALAIGSFGLIGCDDTIESDRKVDVKDDGTTITKEEKTVEKPDGTIQKTEEKTVDKP